MQPRTVRANGVEFAYLESGPPDGPLALCLHGFPDTAHTWRHLLPELARTGYHAVAPWMRGYAPTGLPPTPVYQVGALASDASALHHALGGDERAVVVGHDWGAFAAYGTAGVDPGRWRRVVTMAVPPLAASGQGFFSYRQLKRSFYVFLFQLPLAEAALAVEGGSFIDHLWEDWSPGYDGSADVARVHESLGDPERLAAAVGYYRALFDPSLQDPVYDAAQAAAASAPPQPTLYLHGTDDGAMGIDAIGDVGAVLAPGSEHVVVEGTGHFLHLEQPEVVAGHVLGFLART
ncbi:MAG TPA: alpha/beta hydrolase [Acidimicrobiales bacterium]|nr:alpha/beta hydrolase [Acidimicrobiales bacterium]